MKIWKGNCYEIVISFSMLLRKGLISLSEVLDFPEFQVIHEEPANKNSTMESQRHLLHCSFVLIKCDDSYLMRTIKPLLIISLRAFTILPGHAVQKDYHISSHLKSHSSLNAE